MQRCKAVVSRNVRNFKMDDTMQSKHMVLPLFVFPSRLFSRPLLRHKREVFLLRQMAELRSVRQVILLRRQGGYAFKPSASRKRTERKIEMTENIKRDILMALPWRLLKMFVLVCLACFSYTVFAIGNISDVCLGIEKAVEGEYYRQGSMPMVVLQVLAPHGFIAHIDPRYPLSGLQNRVVFIRQDIRNLCDGDEFHGNPDLYVCRGTFSYESISGLRTVPLFAHCSHEESDAVHARILAQEKEQKQMEEKKQKQLREIAIKEQAPRKEFAADLISAIDFDYRKLIYVFRNGNETESSYDVSISNFLWDDLVMSKEEGRWLDFINIADAILCGTSDVEENYDLIPPTNEVVKICADLTNKCFRVSVTYKGADQSRYNERMDVHPLENVFCNIMESVKNNAAKIHYYSGVRELEIFGERTDTIKPFGNEKYYVFNLRSTWDAGFRSKKEEISKEVKLFGEKLARKEISTQEYMTHVREVIPKFDLWINEMFINIGNPKERPSFIERNMKVIERSMKNENSKAPAEQARLAKYAEEKLSAIKFKLKDYIYMQKDLTKYVFSSKVIDDSWSKLRKQQRSRDWLGMLNEILLLEKGDPQSEQLGENNIISIGDMKSLDMYPCEEDIDLIVECLLQRQFYAEFLFTHVGRFNHTVGACKIDFAKGEIQDFKYEYKHKSWTDIVIPFSIGDGKCKFVFAPDSSATCESDAGKKMQEIDKLVRLGKISMATAEEEKKKVERSFRQEIEQWLLATKIRQGTFGEKIRGGDTKSVKPGGFGEKLEEGEKNNNSRSMSEKAKTSTKIICPECGGLRYISYGQCDKCNGEGRYKTPVKYALGGPMGGRQTQCEKCKGKGELKGLCKRCRGSGKVKQ